MIENANAESSSLARSLLTMSPLSPDDDAVIYISFVPSNFLATDRNDAT